MCDKEKKSCDKCCGKGGCHKKFNDSAGTPSEKPLPPVKKKPLRPVIPPLPKKPDQN